MTEFSVPHLHPGGVHLWEADLDAPLWLYAFGTALPDEFAEPMALPPDGVRKKRSVAGQIIRRLVLARYTGLPPASLRFVVGSHGKPALEQPGRPSTLHFNIAHADNRFLMGVSLTSIGVDIEAIDPKTDIMGVAIVALHEEQQRELQRLPADERPAVFLHMWTEREARLKLAGTGFSGAGDGASSPASSDARVVHLRRGEAVICIASPATERPPDIHLVDEGQALHVLGVHHVDR